MKGSRTGTTNLNGYFVWQTMGPSPDISGFCWIFHMRRKSWIEIKSCWTKFTPLPDISNFRQTWSTGLQLWAVPSHIISHILVNLVTAKDCYQLINLWILNLCQLANTRPCLQTSLNDAIVCKVWALKSMVMIELMQKDTILSQVKWITWKSWNEIK